jgi:sporulation protein YlmC with PRC-barrel domain
MNLREEAIMLRRASELKGYSIRATDGDIGHVDDFYFDDQSWVIRYLVVNTGNWLTGRSVLISPIAIEKAVWLEEKLHISLTRDQVKNSPSVEVHPPLSRQREIEYFNYYGWPYYWEGGGVWGPWPHPRNLVESRARSEEDIIQKSRRIGENTDPHLRSTDEVIGYHIGATDGEIGHLEDLLIDDETWAIQYTVADTRNWWPGKKVLVGLQWIENISWTDSRVYVSLSRETLKNGPEFDPSTPLTPEYEARMTGYYHQLRF